jgi:dihydrofolate synthase/folylpolyglutamate synthase
LWFFYCFVLSQATGDPRKFAFSAMPEDEFTGYQRAIDFLYNLRLFGFKPGLANTRKLASLAGNPEAGLRFIHVAGTNGKGSTCAMLESIYRAAGLRVGLFTSPHLVKFGERIQVNRQLISETDIVRSVNNMRRFLKEFSSNEPPTFFEFVTVMALSYFAVQRCDLVIWETGLGGRLDATNIITPLASVITNIHYDHQQWLGETLADIATEKAGIIKPGVPVVTATAEPDALEVISEIAFKQNAPLRRVLFDELETSVLSHIEFPLRGKHQLLNAAVAIATVRALAGQIPVSEAALIEGLSKVNWPGRFQLISRGSGRKIILDGAHNPAGAETLVMTLREQFLPVKPVLIVGMLKDKNVQEMSNILSVLAEEILLVPVSSNRSATPEEIEAACLKANPLIKTARCGSLGEALERTSQHSFVVVTGSLYLVGEALEILQSTGQSKLGERSLNEWSARP